MAALAEKDPTKLPWRDLFAPAIYYAEHGFPVSEIIAASWWRAGRRGIARLGDGGKNLDIDLDSFGRSDDVTITVVATGV